MSIEQQQPVDLLSYQQVTERTRMSRVVIWRRVREGQFPKPIRMSEGAWSRVYFIASEVDEWIANRMAARTGEVTA
ncbi:MAG: AlpA family phage regulatory protein [Xanthomonadales bacterium]|nr:AlpA family phage regulatory protein [Xanthomonadales bacterium]